MSIANTDLYAAKTMVCKTFIHRFDSDPRLHRFSNNPSKSIAYGRSLFDLVRDRLRKLGETSFRGRTDLGRSLGTILTAPEVCL